MNRKLIIPAAVAALAIAGAAGVAIADTWTGGRPWTDVYRDDNLNTIRKVCDHGRALYLYSGYKSGGVAVVPDAPECRFPAR